MPPIRVLVVDDSVVVRRVVSEALAAESSIEVAGTAASGNIALAKIPQLAPDIVTLDVEMPGLNGLETLGEIHRLYPNLPVIMFSTLTEQAASVTLEALSRGASDYVTKPTRAESLALAMGQVRQELVAKITILTNRSFAARPAPSARPVTHSTPPQRVDVLAIGASTGGPNALAEVIPLLPKTFPIPVVVVQHMPALFTRLLAERLNSKAMLAVREGEAGAKLEPGCVWIAPGNYHMTVARKGKEVLLNLNQDAPENSCRPAVDVLFRSIAQTYGGHSLAVIMTGMGSDGTRGARAICDAGGHILAQDEPTSVVWGMPGAVVTAGLATRVYPLSEISQVITKRVETNR
jgi:two-component system, chemotaxis family, protein-glutamate methylesterase/glutaminase